MGVVIWDGSLTWGIVVVVVVWVEVTVVVDVGESFQLGMWVLMTMEEEPG